MVFLIKGRENFILYIPFKVCYNEINNSKGDEAMKYTFLRYPGGKTKAVTLSYDDGAKADERFTDVINSYGLKCTFNLIGSRVENNKDMDNDFIRREVLAKGHEIANHGYWHKAQDSVTELEGLRDVLDSRLSLEREFGIIIRGMAYPDRAINRKCQPQGYEAIKQRLRAVDIVYSRSLGDDNNDSFLLPDDWYEWMPTSHHRNPRIFEFIDKFLSLDIDSLYEASRYPRLFYMWGHAFEFDRANNWDRLDDICEKLGGHEGIWYATNMEIYEYVEAYRSLIFSADRSIVYNPTLITVWFSYDGKLYSVAPGETKRL